MASVPERCPDTGACHHECPEGGACFRVLCCGPLSIAKFPNDEWPAEILAAHQARQTPEVGANVEWDLFVHSDPEVKAQGGLDLPQPTVDLCRWADCRRPWTEHEAYFEPPAEPREGDREGDFGGGIKGLYCPEPRLTAEGITGG